MSLSLQMVIATLLGVFAGLFLGDVSTIFAPWAAAYIMVLKITTVPYLIGAIIHGVGQFSPTQAKQILKKGLLFITSAWIVNILFIYLIYTAFPHARGKETAGYVPEQSLNVNFAELLIPDNIFYDLANNVVPAIVVFSLLIGLALIHIKDKTHTMLSLQTFVEALTKITSWISKITPFGTFLIIANQAGTIQLTTIKQVATYIILYILGSSLIVFWVFPRITSMLTPISALRWLKQLLPILLLVYTTNVVIVCLPYIMEIILQETQTLYPRDEKAENSVQGLVSVIFNLPLGSLFIVVFILFCSLFYNLPLNLNGQLQLLLNAFLTSLGAVGIGSWVNSLTFQLDTLGLPLDAVNLYFTTLPFTSGFQSMISVMELATLSLLVTLACRHLLSFQWKKITKSLLCTAFPIFLLFTGIKLFNPLPEIQNTTPTICDVDIPSSIPVTIYTEPSLSLASPNTQDPLEHILATKTLRVGYHPNTPPFCFYNSRGHLVGYDIAFAYALARDLGCALEFIPLNYAEIHNELNNNIYDIAMSAISIIPERLKHMCFTKAYMKNKLVFVTGNKKAGASALNDPDITIAAIKGSAYEKLVSDLLPGKDCIVLDSYQEFITQYPDAWLLWEEQEAISWIVRHPQFCLIYPSPSLGEDLLGYAVKSTSEHWLCFLNQWLALKESADFAEKQKKEWILGYTQPNPTQNPRWSILRNVLHWKSAPSKKE